MAQAWPDCELGVWANGCFAINLNVFLNSQAPAIFQESMGQLPGLWGFLQSVGGLHPGVAVFVR